MDIFLRCSFSDDYIFSDEEVLFIKKQIDERCLEWWKEDEEARLQTIRGKLNDTEILNISSNAFVITVDKGKGGDKATDKVALIQTGSGKDKFVVQIDDVEVEEVVGMQYKPKYGLFYFKDDCIDKLEELSDASNEESNTHFLESSEMIQEIIASTRAKLKDDNKMDYEEENGIKKWETESTVGIAIGKDNSRIELKEKANESNWARSRFKKQRVRFIKDLHERAEKDKELKNKLIGEISRNISEVFQKALGKGTTKRTWDQQEIRKFNTSFLEFAKAEAGINFERTRDKNGTTTPESGHVVSSGYDFVRIKLLKKQNNGFSIQVDENPKENEENKPPTSFFASRKNSSSIAAENLIEFFLGEAKELGFQITEENLVSEFAEFLFSQMKSGKVPPGYNAHHNGEYIQEFARNPDEWGDKGKQGEKIENKFNGMNRRSNLVLAGQSSHNYIHNIDSETSLTRLSKEGDSSIENGTVKMFLGDKEVKSVKKIGNVGDWDKIDEKIRTKSGFKNPIQKLENLVGGIVKDKDGNCIPMTNKKSQEIDKEVEEILKTEEGKKKIEEIKDNNKKLKDDDSAIKYARRYFRTTIYQGRTEISEGRPVDYQNQSLVNRAKGKSSASLVEIGVGNDKIYDIWMNGDPPPYRMGSDMRYISNKENAYTFNFNRIVYNNQGGITQSRGVVAE